MDLAPEPDLDPLYPSTAQLALQLSSQSGFTPQQKELLVAHSLSRACTFADISILQYLLVDPHAQPFVDLSTTDEDGTGLVTLTIHGFGSDSERDVEREECVRLLIQQGASVAADHAGWTPLHYAALLCPPTVISHLMTHGCSPFALTTRGLTPLDVITGHTVLPGRESVAILLDATMRGDGWKGSAMEIKRKALEHRMKHQARRKDLHDEITRILAINPHWWTTDQDDFISSDSSGQEDEGEYEPSLYTPPVDYSTMLAFSPDDLPAILDSLITNFPTTIRNSQPANTLYLLARFACLTCDHNWLEELLLAATDAIEETFFSRSEDVTSLIFWLYNTTIWLHLLQCDESINEACEMLGAPEMIEELMNSLFVFVIRFTERRIDQLLDSCLLDHVPVGSDMDAIQFESDWSFLRSFTSAKRKTATPSSTAATVKSSQGLYSPPTSPGRPRSPSTTSVNSLSMSTSGRFSSLRQSFARTRGSNTTPVQALFDPIHSPSEITTFLSALQTLLTLSDINPALVAQLWSQVMYWTACETFNRILTRKKYLCRSRALQIGMNLSILEDWIIQMNLPKGVQIHFAPVRDLLNWLQCLSSISEFPQFISAIQALKHINPLQMRRAVRDYKYEVNEGKMTEECVQYLSQLQKDWERHRLKLGVEALRKEMVDRDMDADSVASTSLNDSSSLHSIPSANSSEQTAQSNIDILFDPTADPSQWEPAKPPAVLGELLDSRHMLPLVFPSDPKSLAATPDLSSLEEEKLSAGFFDSRSPSRASTRSSRSIHCRRKDRSIRGVKIETLQRLDGRYGSTARWSMRDHAGLEDEEGSDPDEAQVQSEGEVANSELRPVHTQFTPRARKLSRKGRASYGGDLTPDGEEP